MFLLALPVFAAPPASAEREAAEPTRFALSVVDKETGEPVADAEISVSFYGKGISDDQKRQQPTIADGKEHTVTLPRPIHVVGTVVDKETGEPIPIFRVAPTLDWVAGSTPFIERSHAFQAHEGRFEWKTGRTDTGHYVRIEGKILQDGKSVTGHRIRLYPVRVANSTSPHFFVQHYSTTNEEGEFVFERVAPGPVSVSPDLEPWEQSELTSAQNVPLVAKPGETIHLSLGTEGRTIRGKIVLPQNVQRDMTWDYGINYLVAMKDGIPVPDQIKNLDFDRRRGYSDIWNASREGRAYFQTLHKHFVKLKPDGSFRIGGVKAGKYELVLRIYDPPRGMG